MLTYAAFKAVTLVAVVLSVIGLILSLRIPIETSKQS